MKAHKITWESVKGEPKALNFRAEKSPQGGSDLQTAEHWILRWQGSQSQVACITELKQKEELTGRAVQKLGVKVKLE